MSPIVLLCACVLTACEGNGDKIDQPTNGEYVINGHKFVDLGLPSGLLWATRNIGAEVSYAVGDYYAWGETTTKDNYMWATYKWFDDKITKYNVEDGKLTLDAADDVATVKWGKKCRIPSLEEAEELVQECEWKWYSYYYDGAKGYLVTGPNGNSIFLPVTGEKRGTVVTNTADGTDGAYSLRSQGDSYDRNSCYLLYFQGGRISPQVDGSRTSDDRCYGYPVRPVATK